MKNEELIQLIHDCVSANELAKAITLLKDNISDRTKMIEITLIKSRLNALEKAYRDNTEENRILANEKNKIRLAILELTLVLEHEIDDDVVVDDLAVYEALLQNLEITNHTFLAQNRIRNKLADMLKARIKGLEYKNYQDLFSNYYHKMNAEELRSHKIVRGYTKNIKEYNYKALDIIQNNPYMKDTIQKIRDLEIHLTIWKSKFESIFDDDESISLIYVGVEERVKFPKEVESELRTYIASKKV